MSRVGVLTLLFIRLGKGAVSDGDLASVLQKPSPAILRAETDFAVDAQSSEGSAAAREASLISRWSAEFGGLGPSVVRMIPEALASDGDTTAILPKVIIPAIPRSGSTLLLDMVTIPVTKTVKWLQPVTTADNLTKFALFEPCHDGDVLNGKSVHHDDLSSCLDLLTRIVDCNFTEIDHLWGWNNEHTHAGSKRYSRNKYSRHCEAANLVAFKTVTDALWGGAHPVEERLLPLLDRTPSLRAVVSVRDPRGIFASWNRVFTQVNWTFDVSKMREFCNYYAGLARSKHSRLYVVRFEDLVLNPYSTMKDIYKFLGFAFGKPQLDWVTGHFWKGSGNVNDCQGQARNFSTCRSNPKTVISNWIRELTPAQKRFFRETPVCRTAADFFDYDISPGRGVAVQREAIKGGDVPNEVHDALTDPGIQQAIRDAKEMTEAASTESMESMEDNLRDRIAWKQRVEAMDR